MLITVIMKFPLTQALEYCIDNPLVQNCVSLVKARLLSDLKWKVCQRLGTEHSSIPI